MTSAPLKRQVQLQQQHRAGRSHRTLHSAFYARERKRNFILGGKKNSCGCFGFSPLSWIQQAWWETLVPTREQRSSEDSTHSLVRGACHLVLSYCLVLFHPWKCLLHSEIFKQLVEKDAFLQPYRSLHRILCLLKALCLVCAPSLHWCQFGKKWATVQQAGARTLPTLSSHCPSLPFLSG